jgi:class 3 adenylate cyclase
MVSLRFTLSAVVAFTVAVVAAVTLSITLTTSLSALRSIGKGDAAALLETAAVRTRQMFGEPQTINDAIVNATATNAWDFPSNDPAVVRSYRDHINALFFASRRRLAAVHLYFADNTQLMVYPLGLPADDGYYRFEHDRVTPLNESTTGTDGQTMIGGFMDTYRYRDNSRVQPTDSDGDAGYFEPLPVQKVVNLVLWNQLVIVTAQGYSRASMPSIPYVDNGTLVEYIPFGAPLYTLGSPKGVSNIYGFTVTLLFLDDLTKFLGATRATPNTVSVALTDGYVTATSDEGVAVSVVTEISPSTPVPDGCASTDASTDMAQTKTYMVCKKKVETFPNAAIAAAGVDLELAEADSLAVKMIDVDSDVYYAAATRISMIYRGPRVQLLLMMPESDIVGDVVSGRNAAIGITCGFVVLMSVLMFALISALLAPLQTVADRMMAAASLDDDDEDRTLSAMSEVADLQEAYYAMNNELARVRSFVPQTVLATAFKTSEVDDDPQLTTSQDVSRSSNVSRSAKVSLRSSRKSRSSRGGGIVVATGLNVDSSLRTTNASVLVVNLRGFSHAVLTLSSRDVVRHVGVTIDRVSDAVADSRGVLSFFHGDHMVATFNAVRPCVAHARKAVTVAWSLTDQLPNAGFHLPATAGVASGRCFVGNLGSTGIKAFSTIGPVFAQATVLERLATQYPFNDTGETSATHARVLTSERVVSEIQHHVRFQYVDIVTLPGGKRSLVASVLGPINAAEATGTAGAKDAEWLYVVEQREKIDNGGLNAQFRQLFESTSTKIGRDRETPEVSPRMSLTDTLDALRTASTANPTHVTERDLGMYYHAAYHC